MKAYLVQTPKFVQRLFRERIWAFPVIDKIYLTFDDGPIPEVTPWVLDTLKEYDAKGTFFCIGDNAQKHPTLFNRIHSEGHAIGNHTMYHLNGHRTKQQDYLEDTSLCNTTFQKIDTRTTSTQLSLFRPPYGKLTSQQSKALQKLGYHIIMWDVLSADFDTAISEEKCAQNVLKHIKPGSIVVFHDSLKAENKLKYTLPKILAYSKEKGWKCEAIQLPSTMKS